jgi:hypothetical protein
MGSTGTEEVFQRASPEAGKDPTRYLVEYLKSPDDNATISYTK